MKNDKNILKQIKTDVVPENRTAVLGGDPTYLRRITEHGEATEFFGGLQGESCA